MSEVTLSSSNNSVDKDINEFHNSSSYSGSNSDSSGSGSSTDCFQMIQMLPSLGLQSTKKYTFSLWLMSLDRSLYQYKALVVESCSPIAKHDFFEKISSTLIWDVSLRLKLDRETVAEELNLIIYLNEIWLFLF